MEKPYEGKAKLNISAGYAEIIVPISRSIGTKSYYTLFMIFWAIGFVVVSTQFLGRQFEGSNFHPFLLIWLTFWGASGLALLRKWVWIMFGKEVITIERNELKIERKNLVLHQSKTYQLNECHRFTTYYHDDDDDNPFGNRKNIWKVKLNGTIMFDYGMKTIEFGNGLDMSEAKHVLLQLAEKNILPPSSIVDFEKLKSNNNPSTHNYWKPE